MEKEIYVLLMDNGGTTHSIPEPFGVAVETIEEATRFVSERPGEYERGFSRVKVFSDWKSARAWRFPNAK
jgi:hypothetical protein